MHKFMQRNTIALDQFNSLGRPCLKWRCQAWYVLFCTWACFTIYVSIPRHSSEILTHYSISDIANPLGFVCGSGLKNNFNMVCSSRWWGIFCKCQEMDATACGKDLVSNLKAPLKLNFFLWRVEKSGFLWFGSWDVQVRRYIYYYF